MSKRGEYGESGVVENGVEAGSVGGSKFLNDGYIGLVFSKGVSKDVQASSEAPEALVRKWRTVRADGPGRQRLRWGHGD
jgi:hypothetical protein